MKKEQETLFIHVMVLVDATTDGCLIYGLVNAPHRPVRVPYHGSPHTGYYEFVQCMTHSVTQILLATQSFNGH
jgi:hypothetical protein